ncbi:MAG TPA: NUDIX hydrolase [Xanthobacteraceae bacterium]
MPTRIKRILNLDGRRSRQDSALTPRHKRRSSSPYSVDRAEITVESWSWAFADDRRDDIARHFAQIQANRPAVWNGRVLLLNRCIVRGGVLRGACFETDFASLCAWRDWDFPDASVHNIFAAAALRAADGAYLLGEMAPSTANAGMLYFPCGTPEPGDVGPGAVLDLEGNLRRELLEETGIEIGELAAEPGWTMVRDGCYLALFKRLTARQNADECRARIMRYIASEKQPEFANVHIVRGPAHFDPRMPRFVTTFLSDIWSQSAGH